MPQQSSRRTSNSNGRKVSRSTKKINNTSKSPKTGLGKKNKTVAKSNSKVKKNQKHRSRNKNEIKTIRESVYTNVTAGKKCSPAKRVCKKVVNLDGPSTDVNPGGIHPNKDNGGH